MATTTEQVQIHPGVPATSVAAGVVRKANEAIELIAKVKADLDRVDALAADVREAFHAIVLGLAPHHPGPNLDWVDGPADGLGWSAIWTELVQIGDRYDADTFDHLGLTVEQIKAAAEVED